MWSAELSQRRFLAGVALGAGAVMTAQLPFQPRAAAADVPVYLDPTATLDDRVRAILGLMSDSQKLGSFNCVPATTLADGYHLPSTSSGGVEGLHGAGQSSSATMFSQAIGFGSTWDVDLVEDMGHVVGFAKSERYCSRQSGLKWLSTVAGSEWPLA